MMISKLLLIGLLVPSVDTTPIPLFIYLDKKGSKYCLNWSLWRYMCTQKAQKALGLSEHSGIPTTEALRHWNDNSHLESQGNWTFVHLDTEVLEHFI